MGNTISIMRIIPFTPGVGRVFIRSAQFALILIHRFRN
jgi:hypothetical protein